MTDTPPNWAISTPQTLRQAAADLLRKDPDVRPDGIITKPKQSKGLFAGGLCQIPLSAPSNGTIVYFHGGGFVTGSPEERAISTAWIAKLTNCQVLSCRYRLAPENPWPAQRDDAKSAIKQALEGGPVTVAGDSAGVSVALWGLSQLSASELQMVNGFVGIYGAFGSTSVSSIDRFGTIESGLDRAAVEKMYTRLGPNAQPAAQFLLDGGPPSYLIVGDLDPLIDETRRWHDKRQQNDQKSICRILPGYGHGCLRGIGRSDLLQDELRSLGDWIGAH